MFPLSRTYPDAESPFDIVGGGGPDSYGYFWSDSNISNDINYDWEESFEMAKDITSESVGKYAESIFKRIYLVS